MTGPELKAARKRLRLNQRDLGDLIGHKNDTISRWEKGHRPVDVTAARLVDVMVTVPGVRDRLEALTTGPTP